MHGYPFKAGQRCLNDENQKIPPISPFFKGGKVAPPGYGCEIPLGFGGYQPQ